ncbi:hypothetical protein [Pricia antarctica]|uniref:hypothetical protein n=1 Tax=Pricia antarctica TaxID=641691 RepID=UPI000B83D8AD|nr:hypothetical protein [Pricia antarctica]
MGVVLCFVEMLSDSLKHWNKTENHGDSPWFTICSFDAPKNTEGNLVRITTLGKPRPFLGVVLCFVEMLSDSLKHWNKTENHGDSPWFTICSFDAPKNTEGNLVRITAWKAP